VFVVNAVRQVTMIALVVAVSIAAMVPWLSAARPDSLWVILDTAASGSFTAFCLATGTAAPALLRSCC
jgi:hypothetical protein